MPRKKNIVPEDYYKPFPARLRGLIAEKGDSHEIIGKAIKKKRQSIGAYADGSTAPSWETIIDLANYFEVSTDYLLGRTEIRSPDISIQEISKYTGLSEKALEALRNLPNWSGVNMGVVYDFYNVVNRLLECQNFHLLLMHLCGIDNAYKAYCQLRDLFTKELSNECLPIPESEKELLLTAFQIFAKNEPSKIRAAAEDYIHQCESVELSRYKIEKSMRNLADEYESKFIIE